MHTLPKECLRISFLTLSEFKQIHLTSITPEIVISGGRDRNLLFCLNSLNIILEAKFGDNPYINKLQLPQFHKVQLYKVYPNH